jgi:hypothetical protein
MILDEQKIDEQIKLRNEIRELALNKQDFGFDFDFKFFLKVCHCYLNPQSYGTRIQNRLILDYLWEKVPSIFDKGDTKIKNNKFGEVKLSYKGVDGKYSFVQLRPYQNCDFYLFLAINPDENYKEYYFVVLKKDVEVFLKTVKATNCHGVDKNKSDKTNNELRFSVKMNSKIWKYLIDNFLVDNAKDFIEKN